MTAWLFLIDDAQECRTQRAVLAAFADALGERHGATVCLTSCMGATHPWPEVPVQAARRLAARRAAFWPTQGVVSVFIPGHVVPGLPGDFQPLAHPLVAGRFTTLVDLDLFAVDNESPEVSRFHAHVEAHPGYEPSARYADFTVGPLPTWLLEGGLRSLPQFTLRPWYSVHAPARLAWLVAVREALAQGRLTLADVEDDVYRGLARPSLLEDVRRMAAGQAPAGLPWPDLALDGLFVVPECRPTPEQLRLLHSPALQARLRLMAHQQAGRKLVDASLSRRWIARVRPLPRRVIRRALRILQAGYALGLRPLVQRLRAVAGVRP